MTETQRKKDTVQPSIDINSVMYLSVIDNPK